MGTTHSTANLYKSEADIFNSSFINANLNDINNNYRNKYNCRHSYCLNTNSTKSIAVNNNIDNHNYLSTMHTFDNNNNNFLNNIDDLNNQKFIHHRSVLALANSKKAQFSSFPDSAHLYENLNDIKKSSINTNTGTTSVKSLKKLGKIFRINNSNNKKYSIINHSKSELNFNNNNNNQKKEIITDNFLIKQKYKLHNNVNNQYNY